MPEQQAATKGAGTCFLNSDFLHSQAILTRLCHGQSICNYRTCFLRQHYYSSILCDFSVLLKIIHPQPFLLGQLRDPGIESRPFTVLVSAEEGQSAGGSSDLQWDTIHQGRVGIHKSTCQRRKNGRTGWEVHTIYIFVPLCASSPVFGGSHHIIINYADKLRYKFFQPGLLRHL